MTTHHTLHEADPTYSLGDKRINRTGYGAMQLAGPDVFGPPKASVMPLRRWVPLAVGIPAAAGLALSLTGVVDLPDLSSALAHLSRRLGAWTYLLVAGLAFLETAAF